MKGKKILAVLTAATMLMGSSMMAFAEEQKGDQSGSLGGTGEVQYVATDDVFSVDLPVVSSATTFNYILDPSGLIAKTSASPRYTGSFESNKTLYFHNATQVGGNDYTGTSDALKIVNKSTQAVDVTITAKIAATPGVVMATTSAMSGDGENLYLAIEGGADLSSATDDTQALTTTGVEITTTIAADADAYEITWNSGSSQYERTLTSTAQGEGYTGFKSYSFRLTGTCKANDEALLALGDNGPAIDVTWTVKDFRGPSVSMTSAGVITISDMTSAKNFKAIEITGNNASGQSATVTAADKGLVWDNSSWSSTDGGTSIVKLSAGMIDYWNGQLVTVKVTLTDDTTITTTATITK